MDIATPSPDLLGLAAVAFVLGMRHGVDADHLAAIDAMTRCNARGAARAGAPHRRCGSRSATAPS